MRTKNNPEDSNSPLTDSQPDAEQREEIVQGLPQNAESKVSEPVRVERVVEQTSRKSTGPQTHQGKRRSKFNAVKHGLFSRVVLLEHESVVEFNSLLEGLQRDFKPQGKMENATVEELAVTLWRKRRYYEVECAENSKKNLLAEESYLAVQVQGLDYARGKKGVDEKLGESTKCHIVRNAIDRLNAMRQLIMADEADKEKRKFPRKLLGLEDEGVYDEGFVRLFHEVQRITEQFRKANKLPEDQAPSKDITRQAIDVEIGFLIALHSAIVENEVKKIQYEHSVPSISSPEVLDRMLRCDAHLSREIDRLLNRLERLQRMRKGHPPPPQVELKIA